MANFKFLRKYGSKIAAAAALSVPLMSHAAIDTSSVTTAISDGGTAVGVVALAVLAVIASVHAFKMIRKAF